MERTIQELYARRKLAQLFIRIVDGIEDDPRKPGAMKYYQAQLAKIDAEIAKIEGKPPPVVVKLKTATLTGKSELGGNNGRR